MRNRQSGFTLLELLIVMAIFTLVIFSASDMFVSLLSDFKQQSKIAVTNIEGILGLEMMRRDIEHAGYGLPWDGITAYSEITAGAEPAEAVASALNDAPSAPRAILSGDNAGWNGTDHLAIKAANMAMSNTCEKWTLLDKTNTPTPWSSSMDDLKTTDHVILISQGPASRTLVPVTSGLGAGGFATTAANFAGFDANRSDTSIAYGIDPNTVPKMPFNRADYYVAVPASASDLPARCAAGTGQLYKAVASQTVGKAFVNPVAVLDCVADMQVVFRRDTNGDGVADHTTQDVKVQIDGTAATAQDIRQVREVRVYILAQEGQRDRKYTHPRQTIRVGETGGTIGDVGRDFDLAAYVTDWQHYRWKLYTMIVNPINLR